MRLYDSLQIDNQLIVSQVHVQEAIYYNNVSSQADWSANSGITQILNKPNLAVIATGGRYDQLLPNSGQPVFNSNGSVTFTQQNSDWLATSGYAKILNKPALSNLALSASFNDINPSTLPNFFNGSYTSLTNVPAFSNCAYTGRYSDLLANSLPDISDIGTTGYLSHALYANGTPIGQLGAAAYSNKYSDLTGIPSGTANAASLAAVATSGKLADTLLSNGTSVGVAGIPSNLLNIPANLVTTSALANLVSNAQLTAATANLVNNAQLLTATAGLVSNAQLVAATANLISRSNLSVIAQSGLLSDGKLANGVTVGAAYGGFSAVSFSGAYSDLTGVPSNTANASSLSAIATSGKLADAILANGLTVSQAGNLKPLAFNGLLGATLLSNGQTLAQVGGLSTVALSGAVGDILLSNGTTISAAGGLANVALSSKYSQLTGQPTLLSQFTNDLTPPKALANTIVGPFSPANTSVVLGGGMQQWQVSVSSTYQVNVYVDGVLQTRAVPAFDTTGVHTTLPTVMFATNLGSGPHTLSLQASNVAYTSNSDVAAYQVTEFAVGNSSSVSTSWQYVTPLNAWSNVAGFQGPSYKKTAIGETRLRGAVAGGTFGLQGPPIFTLPAGYTPSNTFVASVATDGASGEVRVYGNGSVVAVRGNTSGTYLSLDNILY